MPSEVEIVEAREKARQAPAAPPRADAETKTARPKAKTGPRPRRNAPSRELQELKDRFLAWMIARRYAEASVEGTHNDLEWLFKYLGMRGIKRIADTTEEILNDYSLWLRGLTSRAGKKHSAAHIAHRLTGVKWFFKWLAQSMVILADPAEDLELPRLNYGLPQTILNQREARRLLDAPDLKSPVGYRDKALLELLYATGVRTKELCALKASDFDAKARTIFVREGKGGKDRVIPVPPLVAGYVKEYIERIRPRFVKGYTMRGKDDGTLFLNWTGAPIEPNRLKDIFMRQTQAAGIDKRVSAMVLRHSIASHLLENGMDIRAIQEFLGHEKLETTQVYAKVTLKGLRRRYNRHHMREKRERREACRKMAKNSTASEGLLIND